jgi:hypothetical protein
MLSALRGTGGVSNGGIGSLRLADASVLDPMWIPHNGNVYIPNWTAWNMDTLLVTNGWFSIPAATNLQISVTNDVTVWGSGGILEFDGARLDCGGNLLLQSNAALIVRSANTNGVSPDYGALVSVAGNISVATGTWVYTYSATNGGAPLFRAGSVSVAAGGGFNADGRGYAGGTPTGNGQGTGGGKYSSGGPGGGGHGGPGGNGSGGLGGGTYGSSNAPVTPGSGGAGDSNWLKLYGGAGGGVIRIEAVSSVIVNGILSANGTGGGGKASGGGAGGSIQVRCRTFAGSNGTLRANGGAAGSVESGNGGGGRIAVWVGVTPTTVIPPSSPSYVPSLPKFTGSITATNGTGGAAAGSPGTVVLGDVTPAGTAFTFR